MFTCPQVFSPSRVLVRNPDPDIHKDPYLSQFLDPSVLSLHSIVPEVLIDNLASHVTDVFFLCSFCFLIKENRKRAASIASYNAEL